MEADNLKILLGKYYSGDIMPEEYQSLLSALKENHKLTPELEMERKMLLAIESCEFVEPKGFENKIIMAIDRRSNRRRHNILRMVSSGSVAAIILVTITIGVVFQSKNSIEQSQPIAKIPVTHSTVVARETIETDAPDNTMQVVSIVQSKHQSNSSHVNTNSTLQKSRTEIMKYLATLPEVSVTYLTKSMLKRLPKDKAESPLAMLVDKGGMESIRVFQLGSKEAEAGGKKLIDSYLSDITETNYAELLMSQNNDSNEVIIYGFPMYKDIMYYHTVLMYSKASGKKATLIILKGKINENVIGDLIDSFSE